MNRTLRIVGQVMEALAIAEILLIAFQRCQGLIADLKAEEL